MLKKLKASDNKGFTIIEVMIVLAIAGLILLIVFLAVPALQRNARNTERKNDIGSLIGAFNEYVNNNNGTLPASCTGGTPCAFLANAKTQIYGNGGWTAGDFVFTNNGTTAPANAPAAPTINNVLAESYVTCNGIAAAVGTSPNQVAFVYSVETGGAPQEQCTTAE